MIMITLLMSDDMMMMLMMCDDQVCVCPQCGHQVGWMFEPEAGVEAGVERPSVEGFYAIIVNKAEDVMRAFQHRP